MTRLSRPCYDKFRRCPGWAGGGTKFAKKQRCSNGSILYDPDKRLWKWRLHRCNTCDVIVLPYHIRWIDFRWWIWQFFFIRLRLEGWKMNRQDKAGGCLD